MKAISYSLFGYKKENTHGGFDFYGYLRGLMINVRLARLIYPEWKVVLNTDPHTFDGFRELFDTCEIITNVNPDAPLCKAMLWRLKPAFETTDDLKNKYTHVICRDTDSPLTYRERQMVEFWVSSGKGLHAICDSVSHAVPLMGGMIGMKTDIWVMKNGYNWDDMMDQCGGINFNPKGSDQDFLNQYIYPKYATKGNETIIQHYIKGYANTFLEGYYNTVPDIELDIRPGLKESNQICGHVGAAGWYSPKTEHFLRQYKDEFIDILEAEKKYPDIFYWTKDGTFEQ